MVEFEEIVVGAFEEERSDGEYSDDSDDEDDNIADETLWDRMVALQDIVPAGHRDSIYHAFSRAFAIGSATTFIGGKVVYVIITSVLMLGVPYALVSEEDKIISEQEKQIQLQQGMSEVRPTWLLSNA